MRLQLHVGHGKTGSSFLQSWLATNAIALGRHQRLMYPLRCPLKAEEERQAAQGKFSFGNGFVLNSMLKSEVPLRRQHRWWRRLQRQAECSDQPLKGVVFSHEPWTRRLPDQLPQLLELMSSCGFERADLWLLVRDPLEHAISVYGQMVKRHGLTCDLDEWLSIYDFPDVLLRFLQAVSEYPKQLCLRVQHYGAVKYDLLSALHQWLELDSELPWESPFQGVVNRSLSQDELHLMRSLNHFDPQRAAQVGERLVNQLPDCPPAKLRPSPQATGRFQVRWRPVVEALNQQLPQEAQLKLAADAASASADALESSAEPALIALSHAQLQCLLEAWAQDGRPRG